MKTSFLNIKSALLSTTISCLLLSPEIQAQSVGVFGLFESKSEHIQSKFIQDLKHKTQHLGCSLRREGKIIATQGNYDIPDINGFFLMECKVDFLGNKNNQTVIDGLKHSVENLALLEGPVSQFGRFGLVELGNNNSYIFKLSDYNNISPQRRNSDLKTLDSIVKTRNDRYNTEAFVRVQEAYGMKRPDEVVVLYYESAESGDRFRGDNNDIMKLIGKFNKDHLIHSSYLIAQSNI